MARGPVMMTWGQGRSAGGRGNGTFEAPQLVHWWDAEVEKQVGGRAGHAGPEGPGRRQD